MKNKNWLSVGCLALLACGVLTTGGAAKASVTLLDEDFNAGQWGSWYSWNGGFDLYQGQARFPGVNIAGDSGYVQGSYPGFLISPAISAATAGAGYAYFSVHYDISLAETNPTGAEALSVRADNGTTYFTLATFTNASGDFSTSGSHDISSYVATAGDDFRVSFMATGTSSADIGAWYVDNVVVSASDVPLEQATVSEPSTLVMWSGLGLMGLAFAWRKRKAATT